MNFFHDITRKPWVASQGAVDDLSDAVATSPPAGKVALKVFFAVVTVLFSLLSVAYAERMIVAQWRPLPEEWLMWVNVGSLVLCSIAFQWAWISARRNEIDGVKGGLAAGGALTLIFLLGQLLAWQQLNASSAGERARFEIALAMHTAVVRGASTLIVDEFASLLDRVTAAGVAMAVRRWIKRDGRVRLIAATAHEDMPRLLGPDLLVTTGQGQAVCSNESPRVRRANPLVQRIQIEPGTIADYDALSRYHYRAGRPGTFERVLRAVYRRPGGTGKILAGVLVVSLPTRLGRWRELAWPGRYGRPDSRTLARLNRDLRCLSRVVVEPRFRGIGLAGRLVRAYLADPITPATEAVAAMGAASPFFERAGMTPYRLGLVHDDQRLADAIDDCGFQAAGLLGLGAMPRLLDRELRRWWDCRGGAMPAAARRTVEQASGEDRVAAVARLAACRLAAPVTAYAHCDGHDQHALRNGRASGDPIQNATAIAGCPA